MATFESIDPTAENIRKLQNGLNEADAKVQDSYEKIKASLVSINLLLKEPDVDRKYISAMCEIIDFYAADAMGVVNHEAEKCGADYISDATLERVMKVAETVGSKE